MNEQLTIKRTNSNNADFKKLVTLLDNELWNELKEDQATYDQYNKVPDLDTTIVLYEDDKPVACGCFKKYKDDIVEIKRMFVVKESRRKGFSKLILDGLECWAIESGFKYAILETSVRFKAARSLYENSGYRIIENYDQYKGLEESICMKKQLSKTLSPSEFKALKNIEYFDFEEDFIEKNIRCIPMIVRFKMDTAGIKLKLAEWSKFSGNERIELAMKSCNNEDEAEVYKNYLATLIFKYTGNEATSLKVEQHPEWANTNAVSEMLIENLKKTGLTISIAQWKSLTDLQRFALLTLCKEGHENKNFPRAMKEFRLI